MNYRRAFVPNSIIFITFVTYNRQNILINDIDILKSAFRSTKEKYKFEIIAICVLNNHIHMLIKPKCINDYPNIIKTIKANFSKKFNTNKIENYTENESRKNKCEKSIWQRRYFEHTIKNEEDLNKHIDYIHYNPTKHYGIAPKDWKFSSFNKFVKKNYYDINWCNLENKYKINELDYE